MNFSLGSGTVRFGRRRQINNPFIGGLILLVIGLGLTLILSRTVIADAEAFADRPTTIGTVITSEVTTRRNNDDYTYTPRIVYSYQVGGETFTAGRVTLADGGSSRPNPAQEQVDRYPVGQEVAVYYNPNFPTDAVLQPDVPTVVRWLYRAGIAFIVLAAFILVRSLFRIVFRLIGITR